jgi:hypothetical protein
MAIPYGAEKPLINSISETGSGGEGDGGITISSFVITHTLVSPAPMVP